MNKITFKLSKYFLGIISFVIVLCFLGSSIFLSKFYMYEQYRHLENSAKDVYERINSSEPLTYIEVSVLLIKDEKVTSLTHGKMGMMPFLQNLTAGDFSRKGKFKNSMGAEFLYFRLETPLGDIVVFQNNKYSSDYLKGVYIILLVIFVLALLLSLPLISYLGKKFTKPILQLENAAGEISKGNFDLKLSISSKDEIETLAHSVEKMSLELKRKDTLQRDFVANVSHDFKTPLSVIRSYSEAIYDGLLTEENQRKYSLEIIKEVDRLNNLVVDLLHLSKFQQGAFVLNKELTHLPTLLEETIAKFQPMVSKKKLSINCSSLPLWVNVDKKHLERVLYNFIDNAIKFSKENSKINILSTDEINHIKISVIDYGIGIQSDNLKDIWNRYYKDSQSGGMGLGLPICSEILKLHGFQYGVTSSTENGTEFYFLIPKESLVYKD